MGFFGPARAAGLPGGWRTMRIIEICNDYFIKRRLTAEIVLTAIGRQGLPSFRAKSVTGLEEMDMT
jgi:hypothetical protein